MKQYIYFIVFLLSISFVSAAYWVDLPTDCPTTYVDYPGQSCAPTDMCGVSGGIVQCYDTSLLNAPSANTTSVTDQSTSYNGGYIINCLATADASSPYCDNSAAAWCDRNSTCYNINRLTNCIGGSWGSSDCSTCRTGYNYCDGSYVDADGCEIQTGVTDYPAEANTNYNSSCGPACDTGYIDCDSDLGSAGTGCEVQNQSVCTSGLLSGTYNSCTCQVDTSYFETGVQVLYNTITNFLWGINYGSGNLMNLTNGNTNESLIINSSACIIFPDGTGQCSASSGSGSGMDYTNLMLKNQTNEVEDQNWTIEENGFKILTDGGVFIIRSKV